MTHRLRPMEVPDAHAVAALLREAFEPELHPLLPYCGTGAAAHLEVGLRWPASVPGQRSVVAVDEADAVTGFAEWRTTAGGGAFLSYVCVSREVLGGGTGTSLLRHGLRQHVPDAVVELDVFAHNERARQWYARLGFVEAERSRWWGRELPAAASAPADVHLLDWPVALAALERYGFCRFAVRAGGRERRLGLPSPSVVRTADPGDFADDGLLGDLARLLPTCRRAVVTTADDVPPHPSAVPLLTSVRLRAVVGQLREEGP